MEPEPTLGNSKSAKVRIVCIFVYWSCKAGSHLVHSLAAISQGMKRSLAYKNGSKIPHKEMYRILDLMEEILETIPIVQ